MNLWDNHMHSCFSGDSDASLLSMISSAQNKNLSGITFTDHLDIDYKEEPGLFDLDLIAYEKEIKNVQEQFFSSFPILFGIELGLQPHLAKEHAALLSKYNFDFVIGSTHVVHGVDPYYPVFFENRDELEAYKEYYEAILENLESFFDFDAIGHLDYCFRYGTKNPDMSSHYTPYKEIIDEILAFIIKKDIALEVNTGAFRVGLCEPNPCSSILKRYKELGGSLITIGADAHKPADVALRFEGLTDYLKSLGFKEFAVYKKRKPIMLPLE